MSRRPDPVDLLSAIADDHRARVRADNVYDPNVCTSTFDWRESFKTSEPPPNRFRHSLRITCRGYPLTLRSNDRFVAIELTGEFDVAPFSVNRPDRVASLGSQRTIHGWSVFVADNAGQPLVLDGVEVSHAIEALQLEEEESLHVYRNKVVLYSRPIPEERMRTRLEGLAAFAEQLPKSASVMASFEDLPRQFAMLLSRFREWAISDDTDRAERLTRASRTELSELVDAVMPFSGAINQYLDGFATAVPDSASALGALLECAAEAGLLLADSTPDAG